LLWKYNVEGIKRQDTYWEKIFANHTLNKDLYPEYMKNSQNLRKKKYNQIFKNGQKTSTDQRGQIHTQMAGKYLNQY